jgi:hypothetical protein
MSEKLNMLLESAKYSDLQSFLRERDNQAAVASYILDEGNEISFFNKFPGLVHHEYDLSSGVGDVIKINQKNFTRGVGLPGAYKSSRQLSGSEAMTNAAFRQEKLSVGMHRYAVALENFIDKKVLPSDHIKHVFDMLSLWSSQQDDIESFSTLFRDYPAFYAEQNSISGTSETDRVDALIGRGTFNNINSAPDVIYAGTNKVDIEPGTYGLANADTLTDTYLEYLNDYCSQEIGMPPLSLKEEIATYGLICSQTDVNNFYDNSTTKITTDLKTAFQGKGWDNPLYNNILANYGGISLWKYAPIAPKDRLNALAPYLSIKKGLRGTALNPTAKVLAYAAGGETVTGLSIWQGGDFSATPADRGAYGAGTNHYLFLSNGGEHFPYFNGGVTVGANSINKFAVTATIAGYTYCTVAENGLVGRLQLGQGVTATTRWKVLYTGPVYVGTLQIGTNNDQWTFVDDVYRIQIQGIAQYNSSTGFFNAVVDDAGLAAYVTSLKAFLGITTNVINVSSAYQTRTYQRNRRAHLFDTIRSIVYGSGLLYKVTAGGATYAEETRDYGAITGRGMTVVNGKKVVTDAQGLVSGYAIAVFKRPPLA